MTSAHDVYGGPAGPETAAAHPGSSLTVAHVMDASPLSVELDCGLDVLSARFADSSTDVAVVIDSGGRPIGLVTPADVLRLWHAKPRRDLPPPRAGNIASMGVYTARMDAPFEELLDSLLARSAQHVAIVSEDGRLRGLLRVDRALRTAAAVRRRAC